VFTIALAALPFALARLEARYATDIQLSAWCPAGIALALVLCVAVPVLAWRPRGIRLVLPCLAMLTATFLLTITSQADRLLLSHRATLRHLALSMAPHVRDPSIPVFILDSRLNSIEFYLQRLVSRTADESDVVLPLDPDQEQRITSQPAAYLERIRTGGLAYVLAGLSRGETDPRLANWHIVARDRNYAVLASTTNGLWKAGAD
jgi:hypothetical protein